MKTVDIKKAKSSLADYAKGLKDETLIVVKEGKPVVALVNLTNTDIETASLSTNPEFLALIERSRTRHKREGGLSLEVVKRKLQEA